MKVQTKFNQLQLWVVTNLYGEPGFLFDVYTDWVEAKTHADHQNSLHQDDNTCYDVIDLYHYTQYLTGNYENVLQAFNEQSS